MKRSAAFLAGLYGLLCSVYASAQEADTTSAWRYFPLEVGNTWEYEHWHEDVSQTMVLQGYLRWTVEDTVAEGGLTYFVVREEEYDASGQPLPDSLEEVPVRFDTLSARLLARDAKGQEVGWPFGFPCPLDVPLSSIIECSGRETDVWFVNEASIEIGSDTVVTARKDFFYWDDTAGAYSFEFAANVGLVEYLWGTQAAWEYDELVYARVGGAEYGELTGVAAEPTAPSEPFALAISLWPNPSRGSAEVRFRLPEPSEVRIVVYDLLGREVTRLTDGPRLGGEHRVRLGGAALGAGVYVVRLEAGAHVAAARMTRLR